MPEAASDAMYKLQNDPNYATLAEKEADNYPLVEAILAKKAEGRPVTPEEYHSLTQFVDRIERGLIRQQQEEKRVEEERERVARANVPASLFEIPLEKFEVSDRLYTVISETDFHTVGDLMLQVELDSDALWRLNGMGPKAMAELQEALAKAAEKARAEEEALLAAQAVEERRYIFPGGFIPSITAITRSLAKVTDLRLFHLEDITPHYARTLQVWRARFLANINAVRQLGYPETFIRLWEYYLCYCEGAFRERYIGSVQMVLTKPDCRPQDHFWGIAG